MVFIQEFLSKLGRLVHCEVYSRGAEWPQAGLIRQLPHRLTSEVLNSGQGALMALFASWSWHIKVSLSIFDCLFLTRWDDSKWPWKFHQVSWHKKCEELYICFQRVLTSCLLDSSFCYPSDQYLNYYTPRFKEVERIPGILVSPCPSICPSVDTIVSALYLQQYSSDPFHICTSYQATSEGVSHVMFVSNFKNL